MSVSTGSDAGPLATAADLTKYGTFDDDIVAGAGEDIRLEAGWHIAPEVTETLLVDADGGSALILPTLYLLQVAEVRDVSGTSPVIVTGWRKSRAGFLTLPFGRWPNGPETVEVNITHGYTTCPIELLPVLARRCQDAVAHTAGQLRLGSLSIGTTSVGTTTTARDEVIVKRYSL